MHMYNVNEEWLKWKATHARIHARRSKNEAEARCDVQLGRTTGNAKRTTKRKARTVSTKDSKQPDGKQRSKSPRRVQRSAKK